MSVLHFINKKTVEIVYKDNLQIWKGYHVLHDFVEMISFDAKKTFVDFFEKYPLEYYEFLQEVKTKIRRISQTCSKLNIKISPALLKETQSSESMHDSVFGTGHKDDLEFIADKCAIKSEQFQILLTGAGRRIVDYIEKQLFTKFSNINQIILAGEFALSPILQDIIKTSFPAKNVIIPCEANMAAVRGAVFFGQGHVSVVTDVSKVNFTKVATASFFSDCCFNIIIHIRKNLSVILDYLHFAVGFISIENDIYMYSIFIL